MIFLRRTAQLIRHLPILERAEWLWAVVRKPYHWALNLGDHGAKVLIGGTALVMVPPEFIGGSWEKYEPEAVGAFADWVRQHPGGLVLDIGSSVGIYSAIALFVDSEVEVVAFDPDLPSLAAVRRICQHAQHAGRRLRLVNSFITQSATHICSLDETAAATETALLQIGACGGATRYVSLTDIEADSIPRCRLDDLMRGIVLDDRSILIKCDVEGAELLVLSGGEAFLRRAHPELLISVHPPVLPNYGHSKDMVRAFLQNLGYTIRCLAVDHEEHWWCEYKL